jgi:hypothetical protein
MSWLYNGNEINSIEDVPEGAIGYVYAIFNSTTKRIYVGKKNLYSTRKRKLGKKAMKGKDRRLKNYEMITRESKWLTYNSSSEELNAHITRGDVIVKEILQFAFTNRQLTYLEVKWQCMHEVLENPSYNSNILARFFKDVNER